MTQKELKSIYGLPASVNIVPLRGDQFLSALRPHQRLDRYRAAAIFDYGNNEFEIIVARHGGIIASHCRKSPGLICREYKRW